MLRYRMKKLIKMLECEQYAEVLNLYQTNPRYRKAFNNLAYKKIILVLYGDDELSDFTFDKFAAANYEYELEGAFLARLEGFCLGVAASVASTNLLHLINAI